MTLGNQLRRFGAFTPILPGGDQLEAVNLLEQKIGRRLDVVNNFRKYGGDSGNFNKAKISLQQSCTAGRAPMVTWEPRNWDGKVGEYGLDSIVNTWQDSYIHLWAEGLRSLGAPVYLRFAHEMNGNWYPWSGNPELYVAAWQRIRRIFRYVGADNVKFVWCVNASDVGGIPLEKYWPGDGQVDVLGIDGYNAYGGWRPFRTVIKPAYDRVCQLSGTLPVWICETASPEAEISIANSTGHSKADWIRDMFATPDLPRITTLLWFDERNPQSFDWRVQTSSAALSELRVQLAACSGWVPPPGPYTPPVPDRVVLTQESPTSWRISWRQVPSFTRGYRVLVDGRLVGTVAKPATSFVLSQPASGRRAITVASYTFVRQSAQSTPVYLEVP